MTALAQRPEAMPATAALGKGLAPMLALPPDVAASVVGCGPPVIVAIVVGAEVCWLVCAKGGPFVVGRCIPVLSVL